MEKIKGRRTAQSAEEGAAPSEFRKSQSLRLEKQTIRILTGAELRRVGGGCSWTQVTCIESIVEL
jgi:hypothetical protein